MMKIAITGTIGSGKSSVSCILKSLNYPVYDADLIAHDLYKPGEPIYDYLISRYGGELLNDDATINRKILAHHLFLADENIMELEDKIFPEVMDKINHIYESDPQDLVFFEVSMLFEAQLEGQFDEVWVVNTTDAIRYQRLLSRGLTHHDIKKREQRQIPTSTKLKLADRILDNNATQDALKALIIETLERMSA
ncbi:hypothetical protein AOC36_05330 [Erysipelothrix larvae]|uniref:Dephospho-CoA kinase n=2 Tax=Erysipelothrix larvae TaxID=1514105 RepID=A0A120JTN3_9FIRM|nr:hypothetical protein AOC36_05330 [Erysipelothrix larvae]